MRLGYNTNGLAFHRLEEALELIARCGYRSVALTLDHPHLDPTDRKEALKRAEGVARRLQALGLSATVETGARFLLDPWRKHQPTLISASPDDRRRRLTFLQTAVEIAAVLEAESVSFWSGAAEERAGDDEEEWRGVDERSSGAAEERADDEDSRGARPTRHHAVLMDRLVEGVEKLLTWAEYFGTRLAFEPEPGMFIDTQAGFARLIERVDHPLLGLTLDLGHVHCLDDGLAQTHIHQWRDRLFNVHVSDMRRGAHDHLKFGAGEMNFTPILQALIDVDYSGPVHVELSRHAHDAVTTMRESFAFLGDVMNRCRRNP